MADTSSSELKGVRTFPPAPKDFDALTASRTDLARHGLPQRPDPRRQPGLAALWDQRARRFGSLEHLAPELRAAETPTASGQARLFPLEACGYELTSITNPFIMLSGSWTVPNLNHSPTGAAPNDFRTFFGLGFLDVHVEMTVDVAQNVTALMRIHDGTQVGLPVVPGDTINALLCLQNDAAGTASYFLTNTTTSQDTNVTIETGFPPAVTVNAGISRGRSGGPPGPLARFGVVYFDEIVAWTIGDGTRSLTDGDATAMVDSNGSTLARPQRINEFTFKALYDGD